ncbi:hypothetical protein V8G54_007932 [Vigna mungo]|uniref:Uncharacterized protein n=1 Tax=Vigna mungo TaxID=3915 RepID=A0AAQ3P2T2_VIGMU
MDTQLPQIFIHHILSFISLTKILLWIRGTISPMVYTLRFTLTAKNEGRWTKPRYIVWCEQAVATPLKNLSMTLKILHEIHLFVTTSSTFIIAVGPKLILNSVIRVRY